MTIDSDRIGQHRTRAAADAAANWLTASTGVRHYAVLTTTYRVGDDDIIHPRLCWTVRISSGRYVDGLTASEGSYHGCVPCIA